jgi:hypothetical protein
MAMPALLPTPGPWPHQSKGRIPWRKKMQLPLEKERRWVTIIFNN